MKDTNRSLRNKINFKDILVENTKNYKGNHAFIIKQAPKIFDTLCKLLHSKNLSRDYRMKICANIAYFILPDDIYPENIFGAKGYLDDVFLCLVTLKEIEKEYEIEEILEYWEDSPKLLRKLLSEDYKILVKEMDKILPLAQQYLGLK